MGSGVVLWEGVLLWEVCWHGLVRWDVATHSGVLRVAEHFGGAPGVIYKLMSQSAGIYNLRRSARQLLPFQITSAATTTRLPLLAWPRTAAAPGLRTRA